MKKLLPGLTFFCPKTKEQDFSFGESGKAFEMRAKKCACDMERLLLQGKETYGTFPPSHFTRINLSLVPEILN